MEKIPDSEISIESSKSFYLPHHCVLKESSTITKLRVIFDASAKTSGVSLIYNLMLGPKFQKDLFDILIRFRFHKVILLADIAKIYRQINLDKEDEDFHRMLWKESPSPPLKHYRMTCNTYGVTSAGFHVIRPLSQLPETSKHPVDSFALKFDMYVDDLLTGASFQIIFKSRIEKNPHLLSLSFSRFLKFACITISSRILKLPQRNRCSSRFSHFGLVMMEAKALQDVLIEHLATAGFQFRKWSSSDNFTRLSHSQKLSGNSRHLKKNSERNPSQNVGTDSHQQPSGEATSKSATKPKKIGKIAEKISPAIPCRSKRRTRLQEEFRALHPPRSTTILRKENVPRDDGCPRVRRQDPILGYQCDWLQATSFRFLSNSAPLSVPQFVGVHLNTNGCTGLTSFLHTTFN